MIVATYAPGDECHNYTSLDGRLQYYSVSVDHSNYRTDRDMEAGWYGYIYDSKPAIITREIIKVIFLHCGLGFGQIFVSPEKYVNGMKV